MRRMSPPPTLPPAIANTEASKTRPDIAITEEHVNFLLANSLPDRAVVVSKTFYEANPAEAKGGLIYANALIGAGTHW